MSLPLLRRGTVDLLLAGVCLATVCAPRPLAAHEPAPESPCTAVPEAWQVRIVWLVDGLADDAARVPPRDLDDSLHALAALGITNLTMAAQMIVRAVDDEDFIVNGSAKVNQLCSLEVEGVLVGRVGTDDAGQAAETIGLKFAMVAKAAGDGAAQVFCELRTTALVPIGRPTVLGVAPVQTKPSVILVVVTPADAPAADCAPEPAP